MFSRAGRTFTQICGRYSAGMKRALKKNTSQVKIGRTGRKNCLVIGISRAKINNDAAPVFTNGPGAWLIDRENIARMINIMYCPS